MIKIFKDFDNLKFCVNVFSNQAFNIILTDLTTKNGLGFESWKDILINYVEYITFDEILSANTDIEIFTGTRTNKELYIDIKNEVVYTSKKEVLKKLHSKINFVELENGNYLKRLDNTEIEKGL